MNTQNITEATPLRQPMKILSQFALLACLSIPLQAQPYREVTMPTVAEAAAAFPNPPLTYGAIHWAIWGGLQTKERIIADIDHIHANGGGLYMINNSQRRKARLSLPRVYGPGENRRSGVQEERHESLD